MFDPLECLWPHMDVPRPMISRYLVLQWPPGAFDRLLAASFICEASNATCVACPSCFGAHKEKVVVAREDDGSCRYFIYCPVVLRAELTTDDLRQWTIDFRRIAITLSQSMALHGRCLSLSPGRLWQLGKTAWRGFLRDVLFAIGLEWPDADSVIRHIHRYRRPIVITAGYLPSEKVWNGDPPVVVPLSEIASLDGTDLVIDAVVLGAMVADADDGREAEEHWMTRRRSFKLAIRREIKAEQDARLTDDVLITAYKQHGSYRKAAEALVADGISTDRWAVERAVQRLGGPIQTRRN